MRIITLPYAVKNETAILKALLQLPDVWLHVRRPMQSASELRQFLMQYNASECSRMLLHQHAALADEFGIKLVHHTSQVRECARPSQRQDEAIRIASTSTHSWVAFNNLPAYYESAFLSPVFPSISKQGYGAGETVPLRGKTNMHTQAVALGGVSSHTTAGLAGSDFQDFALCGAVWEAADPVAEAARCQQIFNTISSYDAAQRI